MLNHSVLVRNQTKLWKAKTVPLQGNKAWFKDPKSALFEILQDKELIFKTLTSSIQFQNYLTRKK